MSNAAAFSGSYCDMRFVKSRKVAQIVVEIPIEQAAAFVAAFGAPDPAKECPVALARLVAEPKQEASRRRFGELPASQQAAMRCNEIGFQMFIVQRLRAAKRDVLNYESGAHRAARYVREWCGVKSRADLSKDKGAENAWIELDNAYFAWSRGLA